MLGRGLQALPERLLRGRGAVGARGASAGTWLRQASAAWRSMASLVTADGVSTPWFCRQDSKAAGERPCTAAGWWALWSKSATRTAATATTGTIVPSRIVIVETEVGGFGGGFGHQAGSENSEATDADCDTSRGQRTRRFRAAPVSGSRPSPRRRGSRRGGQLLVASR